MKKTAIHIWEGCDPTVAEAIAQFQDRWGPYSLSSRRYHIVRLIQEVIDPAVSAYTATLPSRYLGYIPGAGAGLGLSAIIRSLSPIPEKQMNRLDVMVRSQRLLLRSFIGVEDRQSRRDQRFIATAETLIELVGDCACKQPAQSPLRDSEGRSRQLNAGRKLRFCEFCGELTELASFASDEFQERPESRRKNENGEEKVIELPLSSRYCKGHRPKLLTGEWNPAYRQAKRSREQFHLELSRLSRQCANPSKPKVKSGDPLVDRYFFLYVNQTILRDPELQLVERLKAELRDQARLMVDSKISDHKKQILVLQQSGLNQSEIARKLGTKQQPLTRQAVSKALASIPAKFRLNPLRQPILPINRSKISA